MDDKTICTSTELSLALRKLADKVIIVPSRNKYLRRHSDETAGGNGKDTTQDYYYVGLINDTLREIRKGRTGYIFNARQIADVLSFEPKAEFSFENDAVAVRLPA